MAGYDVVVLGAGHAGCEAALACARMGLNTAAITLNLDSIAMMACNPAIGGTSKGQLVREIDALGGEMGLAADDEFIQMRMLNTGYIRAMRQIGEETGTPVLDLFCYSVELFEKIGHDNIHRYTSIKKGINKGKWPDDFLKELAKPETVSENTHFNKDGAMLITKGLVELILKSKNPQLCELQSALLHNVL